MKKKTTDMFSISKMTTSSPKHERSFGARRCEYCGQAVPAMNALSPWQMLVYVVCVVCLVAILAPVLYLLSNWAIEHIHSFPSNPPWREPLDDWNLL